jgi:penicillin-binding protein 1A
MLTKGFIDAPTYELVTADSVRLTSRPSFGNDFIDYVIPEAEKRFGREAVHYGGLKIYTTLDPQLQAIAEQALAEGVTKLEADLDSTGAPLQGALAAVSVPTGEVRALIGARRYVPGGFNRATNSNRHVGSGIKPFVYITALENLHSDGRSLTPISVVYDTMVTFPIPNQPRWRPRNFDRRHRGQLILKSALMQSINTISAQLTDQLTPRKVIETCRRLGVSSPIDEVLPLSLGTAGISPLEMASAYAVFANNGMYYRPIVIKRVEDVNGTVLDRAFVFGDPRVDPKLTYEMLDMMRGVIDGGTAKVIRASGFDAPAAGKTGTSTEFTDAWFTGFTTSLATSIWVGYDRVYQMYIRRRGVDGARGAAPIWAEFMKRATKLYPVREFEIPSGIKIWQVDPRTGQLVPDPQYGIPVALPEGIEPETPSSWERPPFVPESDTTEAG